MKQVPLRRASAWTMLAAAACLYAASLAVSAIIPVSRIKRHAALCLRGTWEKETP